jgi:hypothetical protein
MFRFNPDAPLAWSDAINRHQRGGDGQALASMIRSGRPMPDQTRDYIADIASRGAKRRRGRPSKVLKHARFDPEGPNAWADAIELHRRVSDGDSIVLLGADRAGEQESCRCQQA